MGPSLSQVTVTAAKSRPETESSDVDRLIVAAQQGDRAAFGRLYTHFARTVHGVATETVKSSPAHLSSLHGGELATQMGPDGVARPLSPVFDALVPLPEDDMGLLRIGLVGQAKITTAPRTLGSRLWRYLIKTFNFDL